MSSEQRNPIHETRGRGGDAPPRRVIRECRVIAKAILESSDDAIIGQDLNGVVTVWNRAAERLYGYTEADAVGQPISMLIPAGRNDELPEILQRLVENGRACRARGRQAQ